MSQQPINWAEVCEQIAERHRRRQDVYLIAGMLVFAAVVWGVALLFEHL